MMTSRISSFVRSLFTLTLFAPAALATGCIVVEGDGSGATCEYAGESYESGESFPASDGCNTCSCGEDGEVLCTVMACETPVCEVGGQSYAPGESWAADCNTCACMDDGTISCTQIWCGTCEYEGVSYSAGESFPASDGCNTCSCGDDGMVGCTEMACTCDPANEPNRDYVSLDPAECMQIDFDCAAPATRFDNECGCGCETPAS